MDYPEKQTSKILVSALLKDHSDINNHPRHHSIFSQGLLNIVLFKNDGLVFWRES